jgi:hypothetical protein
MGDFVKPEPIRLPLSGNEYIDIKKRLNHGEREDLYARMAPYVVPGELRTSESARSANRKGAGVPPRLVADG